jgi:glycine cleavage system aminomethyltransferase T
LLELRRERERRRVVLVASDEPIASGARIDLGGRFVGRMLSAEPSPTRGDVLGIALIEVPYSHPGLGLLAIDGRATRARVVSAPAVDNLSLYIDPQRHSYHTRAADQPIAAP